LPFCFMRNFLFQ